MNRTSLIILSVLLTIGIFIMAVINYKKILHSKSQLASIRIIPEFEFVRSKGGSFDKSSLDKTAAITIFNYFDPDCEHCQAMAKAYWNNRTELKHAQILMITTADSSALKKFENRFSIDSMVGIVLLRDPKFTFLKLFNNISAPAFFIYRNGMLYKKITGETSIENLLN